MEDIMAEANKKIAALLAERDRLAAECALLKTMLPCKQSHVDRLQTAGLLCAAIDGCRRHGVAMAELFGRSRSKSVAAARSELYEVALSIGKSTAETGRIFGRDHSTVVQCCAARRRARAQAQTERVEQ